jgi:hypothetical protein
MLAILHLLGTFVANLFRSRRRLEVENLFLRHQLMPIGTFRGRVARTTSSGAGCQAAMAGSWKP